MKKLLEAGARLLGLVCVLALISCGPGSGGTGTGPGPSSVSLTYIAGSQSASSSAAPCATACDSPYLRLEPSAVELRSGCVRFIHDGDWSLAAGNQATIAGTIEINSGGSIQRSSGSLRLQFDAEPAASAQVTFTVFDPSGNVVLGPQTLQRQDGAQAPATAGRCGE